jgi:kinesin light chain
MTFPCLVQSRRQKPVPYAEYGGWHRAVKMESPNVTTTLKNLSALYRRQGKLEAAEAVESCAMRSKKRVLTAPAVSCIWC